MLRDTLHSVCLPCIAHRSRPSVPVQVTLLYGPADLRRGLRMFSPARLMTTSQRGSPDLVSSLCWRKHRTCWYSSWCANCPPTHLAEAGRTHVIRPGPGCRETNVTLWPLAFSSWVRAVPMNPVPPPDGRAQTVYTPRGGRRQAGLSFLVHPRPPGLSSTLPPSPAPQCRGDTGHGVSGIQLWGLGSQG